MSSFDVVSAVSVLTTDLAPLWPGRRFYNPARLL